MSRMGYIALLVVGCLAALGAWFALGGRTGILERAAVTRQPLSYVGQITLGAPTRAGRHVIVPLSISGGEWYKNSGICFDHAASRVSGAEIELIVFSGLCKGSTGAPPPERVEIPRLSPGSYTVFYRDPNGTRHRLSQIAIP